MKKQWLIGSFVCLMVGTVPMMAQADTAETTDVQVILSKKLTPGVLPDVTPGPPSVEDQTPGDIPVVQPGSSGNPNAEKPNSVGSSNTISIASSAYSTSDASSSASASSNSFMNSSTLPKTGEQANSFLYSLFGGLCLLAGVFLIPKRHKGGN